MDGAWVQVGADPNQFIGAMNRVAIAMEGAVNKMVTDTHKAEKEVKTGWDKISEGMKKTGEGMKDIGEKVTIATAPITAMGLAGIKTAIDVGNAQAKIQSSLGATADQAKQLEDVAVSVWNKGWGDSVEAVTQDLVTLKTNIQGVADVDLIPLLTSAQALQSTFEADVNETTRTASVLMKNFHMNGKQAMDMIAYGFQNGANFSDELLDTLREYSPQFSSMGMNAGQMMSILVAGAKAGAWNLDKVGDAVKEFNIRAKDGSDQTAEAFKAIHLNAKQMGEAIAKGGADGQKAFTATLTALSAIKDPVKQNTLGVQLFGTQWEDLQVKVMKAMGEASKQTTDFAGSIKKVEEATGPTQKLEQSMRTLQTVVADNVTPTITTLIDKVSGVVKQFGDLDPETQETIVKFGGIIAVGGPAIVMFGSLMTGISATTSAIKAMSIAQNIQKIGMMASSVATGAYTAILWGKMVAEESGSVALGVIAGAQWAFNTALTANPIGVVVVALGTLGFAIYQVVKHWQAICEWIKKAWDWLTTWNKTPAKDKNATVTTTYATRAISAHAGANAEGTDYWRGGLTWVGERGPELLNIPQGAQILSNKKSMDLMDQKKSSGGTLPGGIQITIQQVDIHNDSDIEDIAEKLAFFTQRKMRSAGVMG